MGRCYANSQTAICLWSSRTCRWRWWYRFTWRYRLRVRKGYAGAFTGDALVERSFERAGQSRVSSLSADTVVTVDLSIQSRRMDASVTDDTEEMEEIEVDYSAYVPSDEDDDRRQFPAVDQQQVDALAANLTQVTAEQYTQDFLTESSGVAGVANVGVEAAAGSATAPIVTVQNDSPTPAPTSAPVSATGDPHLVNIHGQRFDLMQPGVHSLVHIPRRAEANRTLLDIQADVQRVGSSCADMYMHTINVTGAWASAPEHPAGLFFSAEKADQDLGWQTFGQVKVKVAQGHTKSGVPYLNFLVKSLSKVDYSIGGLLGEDDHTHASTIDPHCHARVALMG